MIYGLGCEYSIMYGLGSEYGIIGGLGYEYGMIDGRLVVRPCHRKLYFANECVCAFVCACHVY